MSEEVWTQALALMEEALAWPWPHGRTVFERSLAAFAYDAEAYARDWRPGLTDLRVPVAVHTLGELAQVPALLPPGVQVMLIMRGRCKGEEGVRALLEALGRHRSPNPIVGLELGANELDATALGRLCAWPGMRRVRYLGLRQNAFDMEGVKVLAAQERLRELEVLDLSDNHLGPWGARALATTLHIRRLKVLDLEGCRLESAGVGDLANASALRHLTHLSLRRNRLTRGGWRDLAESSVLSQLRHIDLRDNEVHAEGLVMLLVSGRLSSLQTCHLFGDHALDLRFARDDKDGLDVRDLVHGTVSLRCRALADAERRSASLVCPMALAQAVSGAPFLDVRRISLDRASLTDFLRALEDQGRGAWFLNAEFTRPQSRQLSTPLSFHELRVERRPTTPAACQEAQRVCRPFGPWSRHAWRTERARMARRDRPQEFIWDDPRWLIRQTFRLGEGDDRAEVEDIAVLLRRATTSADPGASDVSPCEGAPQGARCTSPSDAITCAGTSSGLAALLRRLLRQSATLFRLSGSRPACARGRGRCETWELRALTPEPYVGVTGPRWDQTTRVIWRWG